MGTPDFPSTNWLWDPLPRGHFTPGRDRGEPSLIVLHCTDNDASNEAENSYAHRRTDASAHFYIDDDNVIQTVRIGDRAWSAHPLGNARGVQIEITGRSYWTRAQWLSHPLWLGHARTVVFELAARLGIPATKLTISQVANHRHGVCGHSDCVHAFREGTHFTCPSPNFPWDVVLAASAPTVLSNPEDIVDQKAVLDIWQHYTAPEGINMQDHVVQGGAAAKRAEVAVAQLSSKVDGLVSVLQALTQGGTSVDTAALLARIDQRAAEDVARDQTQLARIAALEAELDQLRAAARAGAQAEAAGLDDTNPPG